ncbi:MAG: pyridoxamine 5'-phosphate oxidase family protein [Candidatus Binatia bacterium]
MWTIALAAGALAFGMAAAVAADFPQDVSQALRTASYIYVATQRADGSRSKIVPVWFTTLDDAVYFTTAPTSYKAKRIAKGSPVWVWVDSEQGPHFEGKAELVHDPALATRMGDAYNRKYWIAWLGLFRPRADRVQSGKTVIVKITPKG